MTTEQHITFTDWLHDSSRGHGALPANLIQTLMVTAEACRRIGAAIGQGALAGVLGAAGSENVQGEDQKKLDVIANDILLQLHSRYGFGRNGRPIPCATPGQRRRLLTLI